MDLSKLFGTISGMLMMLAQPFKKADSSHGIKEVGEALHGANALSIHMVGALKDGLQMGDVTGLLDKWKNDEEFKAKLVAAAEGASAIPAEVKDLDAGEGIELAAIQVDYIDEYVAAAKKV